MKKKKRGNGSPKFTKEQVKQTMLALQEKRLKIHIDNKEILRKVKEGKKKWDKLDDRLKLEIANNIFNS